MEKVMPEHLNPHDAVTVHERVREGYAQIARQGSPGVCSSIGYGHFTAAQVMLPVCPDPSHSGPL